MPFFLSEFRQGLGGATGSYRGHLSVRRILPLVRCVLGLGFTESGMDLIVNEIVPREVSS